MGMKPNHLNQNSGSICIGLIVFILALIGAWFVYKSCQEHRLKENLKIILNDYKKLVVSAVKDEDKRDKLNNTIDDLLFNLDKYSQDEIWSEPHRLDTKNL
jgi:hypothetical protein